MAGEHVHRRLAGAVAVVLDRGRPQPVDRADVDHPRGVVGLRGGSQSGEQADGQVEDPLEVRVQDPVPSARGELLERRAPDGAGVVDEYVERGKVLSRGRRERGGPLGGRHIARVSHAVTDRRELRGGRLDVRLLARGDDHPGARIDSPRAIISPIPREPPVTRAVFPETSNSPPIVSRRTGPGASRGRRRSPPAAPRRRWP